MHTIYLTILAVSVMLVTAVSGMAQPPAQPQPEAEAISPKPFGLWVEEFKKDAEAQGIRKELLDYAFNDLNPNPRIVELDRRQPEGTKRFTDYLQDTVSTMRIRQGQKKMDEHRALLEQIGREYQVQPRFIVALWGKETNYGGFSGSTPIIEALATLAYDGRRSEFFRDELLKALRIVQDGHIGLSEMQGSWAGAMGQCQFMPSSFLKYAVDYDKDGRIDIWHSHPDIFASIANYLKQSGWNAEETWGREVKLPPGFDPSLSDGKQWKTLPEWSALGITNADGSPLPQQPLVAAVTMPGTPREPSFIVYRNYDVILQWNKSRYFATAVGKLADYLNGV